MKKVFVSGCYDMLHSGHVAFFKEASQYGELHVGIGSDRTIAELLKDPDRNAATHDLLKARLIQEVKNDDALRDIVMAGHTIWHTYVDSSGEYLIDLGCRREDLREY